MSEDVQVRYDLDHDRYNSSFEDGWLNQTRC